MVRGLLTVAKADDWEAVGAWLQENPRVIEIFCIVGRDEVGRPQLEFQPRNLIGFIYAQLIQDYTSGAQYKLCIRPGCGKYFYYGSGTRKRNTSSYCTDTCQKSHYYQTHKGQRK